MLPRHALQTYYTAISITAAIPKIICKLGDETASWVLSNGIGSRFGVFTTALLKTHDAMKALTIPASRVSISGCMRSAATLCSASVSNLRGRVGARTFLTMATAATASLFFCLGLQSFPGVLVSGLTALSAAALAPVSRKGGAE